MSADIQINFTMTHRFDSGYSTFIEDQKPVIVQTHSEEALNRDKLIFKA